MSFIDETGFSCAMCMNYDGQSVARSPVHKKVQHLKRPNYSVVCCIFHSKQISYECSQRPYNRDGYGMWLSRLFVHLSEAEMTNCTIVLNNVPFHRSMAIQQTFSAHGHYMLTWSLRQIATPSLTTSRHILEHARDQKKS